MSFQVELAKTLQIQNLDSFGPLPNDKQPWPQVGILGKSNVGKSTLINAILNQKIARHGKTPGLTSFIQVFKVFSNQKLQGAKGNIFLLDFPGYGYAQGPKSREQKLRKLIESFFSLHSGLLSAVLFLLDIRRVLDEKNVLSGQDDFWLEQILDCKIPTLIVLTKTDKVSQSKIEQAKQKMANHLSVDIEDIFAVSGSKKTGTKDLRDFLFDFL